MKNDFIGFYDPTEEEINNAWTNGSFAFDANTLLNLYRYSEQTRKDFLSALKSLKDKLFIPHQVALEYHSNRSGVIEGIGHSYSNLYKVFESNFEKNLEKQINQFKKHPAIIIEKIFKLHTEFLKKVSTELETQKTNHPDFKTKDDVLNELTDLFKNALGKEFSKEQLKKIYDEGKERYLEKTPPGFMDLENKKSKGDRHIYGDLIIWKELINYSKSEKKQLIFVTDDRKEDWWTIENGKTVRPREELIKEFFNLTGIRILIYNADNFLKYAKAKKLLPSLKNKTIEEVKETRISDEFVIARDYLYNSLINQSANPFSINVPTPSSQFSINKYVDVAAMNAYPFTINSIVNSDMFKVNNPLSVNDYINSGYSKSVNPFEINVKDLISPVLNPTTIKLEVENNKPTENNSDEKTTNG